VAVGGFHEQPVRDSGAADTATENVPPEGETVTSRLPSAPGTTDWDAAPDVVTSPPTAGGM